MKYFWLGGILLGKGSTIMPGNWVRIVRSTPGHHWALLEEVFENIRRASFPELPSRGESLFICEDRESALEFQRKGNRAADILYEVELVSESANSAHLDVAIINPFEPGSGRPLTSVELANQAVQYWSSSTSDSFTLPEILTESSIRILRKNTEPQK